MKKNKLKKFFINTIKFSTLLLFVFFITICSLYTYASLKPKLEIKNTNTYFLYDKDNNLYFQGNGSKEWVNLSNISKNLIDATISTEDKNFYNHYGFDIPRIIKAAITNIISNKKKQGASTITQQYAKNLFLDFDKTWERKIKEMWITIQLETHYSKDELLEGYLNTINYGHATYGIENASKFYFDKNANELTIAESALLASIPKSPSNYSPFVNYEIAKKRQENILYAMYKNKKITKIEYEDAIKEEIKLVGQKETNTITSIAYYEDAVMKELNTLDIPSSLIETGGLKIYTNLDQNAQQILENSIASNINSDNKLQAAAVMVNPQNGKVIALIGGKDYKKSQYNRAYSSKRQLGSAIKPLLYYAALENGFTSSTTFKSEKTTFYFSNNNTYSPQNYGDSYSNKDISLAAAISYSDNVYAVKTHMFLGEDTLINISKKLGITSKLEKVPSLALGTASINMLEIASAYSSFANEGYEIKTNFINKVEDLNGNILYEKKYKEKKILDTSLTFILSNLLTSTYDSSFIGYSYPTAFSISPILKHKLALKSGSTNTDNWSIGYNKEILTAVWVGYDDNSDMDLSDYKYSKVIWANAIENYLNGHEDSWYEIPNNVVGALVNPITGKIATQSDKNKKILYYIKGTEPSNTVNN